MGRRRARTSQFLEPNLYQNKAKGRTYWQYRHPITKAKFSLGSDKGKAVEVARQLNARLLDSAQDVERIVNYAEAGFARPASAKALRFSQLVDEYIERRVPEKRWSEQTLKNELALLKSLRKTLGKEGVNRIDVLTISDLLEPMTPAAYTKHRARLVDLFGYAKSRGYLKDNPAADTLPRRYRSGDKQRERLALDHFWKIHEAAPAWLQVAMELALITLQRRGDIVTMRYTDFRPDKRGIERLYVVQNKTKTKSDKAFLAIRVSDALRAVVSRSRADGIASPFVVHYRPGRITRKTREAKEHWTQVTPDHLTKTFASVRDDLHLFDHLKPTERPTFHEIRALGIHVYEERLGKGGDFTQGLAGHADRKMTELYAAGHEPRFNDVDADMDLSQLHLSLNE